MNKIQYRLFSLELYNTHGPDLDVLTCSQQAGQTWISNSTDGTIRTRPKQAVVLLNRVDNGSEPITVQWKDIGFPVDHSALVRDL